MTIENRYVALLVGNIAVFNLNNSGTKHRFEVV